MVTSTASAGPAANVEVRLPALVAAGPRTAVLLAPVLLLLLVRPFVTTTDPDYWWHVATGRLIVTTGAIPRIDPFSFTATGHAWTAHEWLTEVLFYVVSAHAGYVGNAAIFGLIGAVTALLLYATCRLRGLGELPATILTLWGSVMGIALFNVRPQAITALFLALTAWIVTRYLLRLRASLWLLPPLFALWVNLHGGYVIGLAFLALTVAGQLFERFQHRTTAPLRPLLIVTACSAAATLLNPHGAWEWLYPLSYLGSGNDSMQFIAEWQSPNFHQAVYAPFVASILLTVGLGLWRRPLGWTELLWALVFTLLGLQSVRHLPLYALIVVPLVAGRLSTELPTLRQAPTLLRRPVVVGLLGLVAVLVPVGAVSQAPTLQTGVAPNDAGYPAGATAYLRSHELPGNLFNDYDWGGYLINQLYPARPVFVDGRADVYAGGLLHDYARVVGLAPGWQQVLTRYEVGVVLMPTDSALVAALAQEPGWRVVYHDGVSVLLARQP